MLMYAIVVTMETLEFTQERPRMWSTGADLIRNKRATPVLPLDLVQLIADALFEVTHSALSDSQLGQAASMLSHKPAWREVAGFMNVSLEFQDIGMKRWVRVLSCKSKGDLEKASRYAQWIRELKCFDQPSSGGLYGSQLNQFKQLHTLSLDLHGDIHHDGRRFAYRDVFTSLPPSLRRLEIRNAHGPDAKTIAIVKQWCPNLQELRLGRCNMFNRSPACEFWRSFPFEHDSYISNDGTDEYAGSLAHELAPLRGLKTLQVGIYLIPTSVVLAHRIYHAHKISAPDVIIWQQAIPLARSGSAALLSNVLPPALELASTHDLVDVLHQPNPEPNFNRESCAFCRANFLQASVDAELSATSILKSLLPSLREVQWQGWFTPNHQGISSHSCNAS
ncbi:hypothetical protein B0J17DRAFT_634505 [Rhizoctonia solani]|nr:hypothetical protein B0J17DRAFT_634505 [Rhizoctonia solani]